MKIATNPLAIPGTRGMRVPLPMRRANRFLNRPKGRRMAAFVTAEFPKQDQTFAYELVQRLSLRVDADYRFAYQWPTDPSKLDANTKYWLSRTLIAPSSPLEEAADLEHFRHAEATRCARALTTLAEAMGVTEAEALAKPHVRAAFSMARIVKAWGPDLLLSFHAFEASLQAWLVSELLDLPRVLFVYDLEPANAEWARLLPLQLQQASLIVVRDEASRRRLGERHGAAIAAKATSMEVADWEADWSRRVTRALRQRPAAVSRGNLGPAAAFRTHTIPLPEPGIVPFVVAGAERTGSNLLIDMLLTHPRIVSAGELFNTKMIETNTLDIQLPAEIDRAELLELRTRDPGACWRKLLAHGQANRALASGFKLIYYHGVADNRVIDHLLATPSLRVIHLLRDDRLARWTSFVRAERSNQWWVSTEEKTARKVGPVRLDPTDTLVAFEYGELQEERFSATFAASHMLEMSYEELAQDPPARGGQVLDFLDVPRMDLLPLSQKTGDSDVRKLIANWQELVDAFADTRWQDQFARDLEPERN